MLSPAPPPAQVKYIPFLAVQPKPLSLLTEFLQVHKPPSSVQAKKTEGTPPSKT